MEYGLKRNEEDLTLYYQTEKAKYSLLEGMTIGGLDDYTSDILFIVDDEDVDKPAQVVGFLYGAFLLEKKDKYFLEALERLINNYEMENNK